MNPELGQFSFSRLNIARSKRWDAVATTTTLLSYDFRQIDVKEERKKVARGQLLVASLTSGP